MFEKCKNSACRLPHFILQSEVERLKKEGIPFAWKCPKCGHLNRDVYPSGLTEEFYVAKD